MSDSQVKPNPDTSDMRGFSGFAAAKEPKQPVRGVDYDTDTSSMRGHVVSTPAAPRNNSI